MSKTMTQLFFVSVLACCPILSLATPTGEFRCQNNDRRLPDNIYRFETTLVSEGGSRALFVHAERYFMENKGGELVVSPRTTQGFATVSKAGDKELVQLGALRFEFNGDELLNCKKP